MLFYDCGKIVKKEGDIKHYTIYLYNT